MQPYNNNLLHHPIQAVLQHRLPRPFQTDPIYHICFLKSLLQPFYPHSTQHHPILEITIHNNKMINVQIIHLFVIIFKSLFVVVTMTMVMKLVSFLLSSLDTAHHHHHLLLNHPLGCHYIHHPIHHLTFIHALVHDPQYQLPHHWLLYNPCLYPYTPIVQQYKHNKQLHLHLHLHLHPMLHHHNKMQQETMMVVNG